METIQEHWAEIENSQLVRAFYGKYPSLHDSEIIEIRLNRELGHDFSGPKVFLTMFVFDSSVAPNSPGRKNAKLTLAFSKVESEEINGFNHQNAISDFHLGKCEYPGPEKIKWNIDIGEFGAHVSLKCCSIAVLSIEPFEPEDYFKNNTCSIGRSK
jgi:hypothetical protein